MTVLTHVGRNSPLLFYFAFRRPQEPLTVLHLETPPELQILIARSCYDSFSSWIHSKEKRALMVTWKAGDFGHARPAPDDQLVAHGVM